MAVDTRDKRSSALNVGSPWRGMLPAPDGTVGAADRQHAALHYGGILAGGAPAPAPAGEDALVHILRIEIPIEQILAPMAVKRSGRPSFESWHRELDDEETLGVL